MTHEYKGRYAEKHPSGRKVNERIREEVKARSPKGEIPCAVAFDIADHLSASPAEVGFTIDFLEVTVIKCQLGLFGYGAKKTAIEPAETVSEELAQAIRQSLVNGRLPCAAAWEIAKRLNLGKMDVSSACEALKLKISSCQLGTF